MERTRYRRREDGMDLVDVVARHRWTGDDTCTCACGEDVGNDHSWALHLLAAFRAYGYTLAQQSSANYPNGAQVARRS